MCVCVCVCVLDIPITRHDVQSSICFRSSFKRSSALTDWLRDDIVGCWPMVPVCLALQKLTKGEKGASDKSCTYQINKESLFGVHVNGGTVRFILVVIAVAIRFTAVVGGVPPLGSLIRGRLGKTALLLGQTFNASPVFDSLLPPAIKPLNFPKTNVLFN